MGESTNRSVEIAAVLVGWRKGRVWHGRLRQRCTGAPHTVAFDWAWALEREERYGDLIGFFHTHPAGLPQPSARDVRTMQAWVSCTGKPLLCLIESSRDLGAFLFEHDEDVGRPLGEVQRFPRGFAVGVEE